MKVWIELIKPLDGVLYLMTMREMFASKRTSLEPS